MITCFHPWLAFLTRELCMHNTSYRELCGNVSLDRCDVDIIQMGYPHGLLLNSGTRELTLNCKLKCYFKPMNNPLGVSPSKGKQGTTRGKEKIFWPRWESNPRPTDLDIPSLCRLSYKVAQRKSGTILDGESRRRESMGTNGCCAA